MAGLPRRSLHTMRLALRTSSSRSESAEGHRIAAARRRLEPPKRVRTEAPGMGDPDALDVGGTRANETPADLRQRPRRTRQGGITHHLRRRAASRSLPKPGDVGQRLADLITSRDRLGRPFLASSDTRPRSHATSRIREPNVRIEATGREIRTRSDGDDNAQQCCARRRGPFRSNAGRRSRRRHSCASRAPVHELGRTLVSGRLRLRRPRGRRGRGWRP